MCRHFLPTVATGEATTNRASLAREEDDKKANIVGLFSEIAKLGETLNGVATDVTLIKSDTTELKNSVAAIQTWLTNTKGRIFDVEDHVANLSEDNSKLTKLVKQLWTHVDN